MLAYPGAYAGIGVVWGGRHGGVPELPNGKSVGIKGACRENLVLRSFLFKSGGVSMSPGVHRMGLISCLCASALSDSSSETIQAADFVVIV